MKNIYAPLSVKETWEFINPEGEEDESDIEPSDKKAFDDVVIGGADWTADTILSQLKQGNIILGPHFQRREAWKPERQSRFIESLFLGLPVPQLVLAESHKQRGKYMVIDGKQRLLSLLHFAGSDAAKITPLKLNGLKIKKDLNGKTHADIQADPILSLELSRFENQTIRTMVLKNWKDEDYIYLVFLRLNTENVKLSTQELRLALHPGRFMDFALERSSSSLPLMRALNLKEPDFRMRDVELFIRYFGFRRYLKTYAGNLKSFLDKTCALLNDLWNGEETSIRSDANNLDAAIECTETIFSRNSFKKWNGVKYENSFNRAVFDIMTFFFSETRIRDAAVSRKTKVEEAFRSLCEQSPQFIKSIETTTKSIQATRDRLTLWGERLSVEVEFNIQTPEVGVQDK